MQNLILKLRKSSIVSKKPGNLSETLKTLSSNYTEFIIFCWNFAHLPYFLMSTKVCSGEFLFCLDLELITKIWKQVCRNQVYLSFAHTLLQTLVSRKCEQNSSKKHWTLG